LRVGDDIFLVYSPEREDSGNEKFTTQDYSKIAVGVTENCLSVGIALYEKSRVSDTVSSSTAAEMQNC